MRKPTNTIKNIKSFHQSIQYYELIWHVAVYHQTENFFDDKMHYCQRLFRYKKGYQLGIGNMLDRKWRSQKHRVNILILIDEESNQFIYNFFCYNLMLLINIYKQYMDQSIESKQQFLRIEILQAQYDPQDFIEFMSTNSPIQSPSIQTLTLDQLKKIVQAYKYQVKNRSDELVKIPPSKIQSPIKKQINEEKDKKGMTAQKLRNIQEKKNKIQYDKYGTFDYELKCFMKCIEADKLTKIQKIFVTIPEMERKQTQGYIFGIGGRTEYFYHIKSNLIKGNVRRLSEDFDWLNNTLLRLYPYLHLPQLEPVRKDIKDPYLQRQKDIEQYLQHLTEKNSLTQSYVFVDFLTLSSEKMEKYKKSYDSIGFEKGVSLLKSENGLVEIELSNKTRDLFNNSKQFCRKTGLLHQKIADGINKMLQSVRVAMKDTYTVVDLFAQLYDAYSEMSNKFPSLKKQQYSDTLVGLNNFFLGIGDNLKNLSDTIDKNTKDYFRFYAGLDQNIQKLHKTIKQSEAEYLQYKNTLQKKKERVISDPSKWDLDNRQIDIKKLSKEELMKYILPKQVLAQNELKAWYAFNLKNYQAQLTCYVRFLSKRYQKVFNILSIQLLQSNKNYLQSITDFITDGRKISGSKSSIAGVDFSKRKQPNKN